VHEGEATLPDILRLLDNAQIGLKTISLSQPTLDDVFLRQTGRSLQDN
jgi:ABC-2 type transport system ATP-binding protein